MGLLATLAAHDLGLIDALDALDRIERTLNTVEALERHRGHLLNWYDTTQPGPAAAALRLDRRQRQPGGSADRARGGVRNLGETRRGDSRHAAAIADATMMLREHLRVLAGRHPIASAANLSRSRCARSRAFEPSAEPADRETPAVDALERALAALELDPLDDPDAREAHAWGISLIRLMRPPDLPSREGWDERRAARRGSGQGAGGRDGLHVPVRLGTPDLLDRVPAPGRGRPGTARHVVLRPARFRGAAGELRSRSPRATCPRSTGSSSAARW